MAEVLKDIRLAANCSDECVVTAERLLGQSKYWHMQMERPLPGMEATIIVDDEDLRDREAEAEMRRRVVERFKADHRYWEEGVGLDLTEDEEERERARLQPVPLPGEV